MDLEPLTLPVAAEEPRRQPIPILAAVVPIAGGVVLWLITGSVFSLCFAALGPLMIGASLIDSSRGRRRARRRSAEEEDQAWRRVEQELRRRHRRERRELRRTHPDAAAAVQTPPLRDVQPIDDTIPIVIGSGERSSTIRVVGRDDDRGRSFRERASKVADAPITVPLGRGVCLRGPFPVVSAAARALVVQLCLQHSSAQLALTGSGLGTLGLDGFPHAGRARRGAWRLDVALGGDEPTGAAAHIWLCGADSDVPAGITTVIDVVEPMRATVRTAAGTEQIVVECLSRPQAVAIAASSAERDGEAAQLPDAVALSEISSPDERSGLIAAIGRSETDEILVDLVEDGPHAIVTGMTGSGKSELLVTWIVSMALAHGPEQVSFVLADFKGGTAFDPLRDLPHVAAVMTDLDDEGARRGVESLTAELRRREAVLADLGVRNIAEARGHLGRLVIVVDEFAALLQEHPDLADVFTDIAARGRALGMHLILGTQRAAGVIRDALAANCPMRVSLRVSDSADSRLVIGTDEAAELPGGPASRGLAMLRRPQDSAPVAVRVALTGAVDLRAAGARWGGALAPPSPWLPPLPLHLALEDLARDWPQRDGSVLLGLCDEPERQRQRAFVVEPGRDRGLAIVGGSGSGRSSMLRTFAAQSDSAVLIPADPETAWDLVASLDDTAAPAPELVLCDDLDQLVGSLPVEHGQVILERLERLIRAASVRRSTVVVTTGRVSGQLARVLEALPTRMLLRTGSKLEHLAAGGDNDGYRRDRPAGRARIDEREVQIAWTGDTTDSAQTDGAGRPYWTPSSEVVGVVAPGVRRAVDALGSVAAGFEVTAVGEETTGTIAASRKIIVGDAESWQRHWSLWQRIRTDGEMLILAECSAELRTLAGCRELPPYAHTHRGRAWSIHDGRSPRRVVVPQLAPESSR